MMLLVISLHIHPWRFFRKKSHMLLTPERLLLFTSIDLLQIFANMFFIVYLILLI